MNDCKRREFILNSIQTNVILGSDVLFPNILNASKLEFKDLSCGDMNKKRILVAYASEYGSTNEVAKYIGSILCQNGNKVDVQWIQNINNLDDYDSIIIGSPIQYDTWMPDAIKFITKHQDTLSKLEVSYFFTCLTLSKKTKQTELQANEYANNLYKLIPKIKPKSIGQFSGVLDYSKMSFLSKIIFKSGFFILGVKEGDYRNWADIKSWTNKQG